MAKFFKYVSNPQSQKDKLKNRLLNAIVFLVATLIVSALEYLLEFDSRLGWHSVWMTFFYSLFLLIDYIRYRLSRRKEDPHDP